MDAIAIRGARQHNLRDVSLDIPREKLVVLTGVSGSGKTSLALDTIFAEGQRRYVESLSAYARQFLAQMPKPKVESIDGLSPAIAIEQRNGVRNPRSTVGTVTEVADHLRLLFANAGLPHCPSCGKTVRAMTVEQMIDHVMSAEAGRKLSILAPVARGVRGTLAAELKRLRRDGFVRVRLDGVTRDLEETIRADGRRAHDLEVYVDRLVVKESMRARLAESLETALKIGGSQVIVGWLDGDEETLSERHACADCGVVLPPLEPRLFSFNSPAGACPTCAGLGEELVFEAERVVPEPSRTLREGAVAPWASRRSARGRELLKRGPELGFDLDVPWKALPEAARERLLNGEAEDGFEGVLTWLRRRLRDFERRKREEGRSEDELYERVSEEFHQYMDRRVCATCGGARLRPEALAVTVGGHNIAEVGEMTVSRLREFLAGVEERTGRAEVIERVVHEIDGRARFLEEVGLHYLTMARPAATLAGGEAQRIRLATQIGASLTGVLYVLDEPTVGLHQRDTARLLATLRRLRDQGNSVLVVEHDKEVVAAADWVIDIGPGAGVQGGRVVAQGTPREVAADAASVTGGYLSGRLEVPLPRRRRGPGRAAIEVRGASAHNLRDVTVRIPLGLMVCVTGVSGAGKSSLVTGTLAPELRRRLTGAQEHPGPFESIRGDERIDSIVAVDQAPIGRTPRSNPATYTGLFSTIRELFAGLPESRARGWAASRFSFNVKGGRCESCKGDGTTRVEMHFLPDVFVTCEACGGRRYHRETLEVRYKGLDVAEVLDLTIDEALPFLESIPSARRKLETLQSVGLGYLRLGQSAATLSGGEAQRIKLARELSRRSGGHTLYVLDEPTTGLHFEDVRRLLEVLDRLVDQGNTVLVVEHDLDVIKRADWVIDLGPEGGEGGGRVVGQGPPEVIAATQGSHTGRYLRPLLRRS